MMGSAHYHGKYGLGKDKAKGIAYLESAAMQGDVETRHNLGLIELDNGYKYNRALRHFLICAKMGHKKSLDMIKDFFADGLATRAQYMEGLKGYQDAVEDMKSPQRDETQQS
ncbi:hypothetical protein THAOC_21855 [Thalassiosira oceanica]|uniref:Uncharacterized protein n=1 Tax=Thalassiosira oceanica TaxID=159749 RepID=K0SHQ2_THAOC|nr:hypothetical protein THAOC_21855 [Thalassiosira oceanica]|eukprot:EJK58047.1 hypothetical protein THAOC_21855 [Thalassiosira oceanica]